MRFRALALFAALILLLLPAVALAQSAGDEQYSDPFGDKAPSSGSSPSPAPTAQAPNPSPTTDSGSQLASDPPAGSSASSNSSSSSSGSLPNTGLRAWMLAVTGGLMLLAGACLRAVIRPLRVRVGSLSPPVLGRDIRLTRTRR
jgi:hypothetical protein